MMGLYLFVLFNFVCVSNWVIAYFKCIMYFYFLLFTKLSYGYKGFQYIDFSFRLKFVVKKVLFLRNFHFNQKIIYCKTVRPS